MALTKLNADLNIISALDDQPNDTGGLTAAALKAKFDEGPNAIKTFLNGTMAAELDAYMARTDNPHKVTAAQVGLGNVNNTADADKPVSTAQAAELALKADKANVLQKDNAQAYTPTGDYHPATKRYVDSTVDSAVLGHIPDGSITEEKMVPGFTANPKSHTHQKSDVTGLDAALSAIAQESATYPGCFYRVVSGVTEWLNQPMQLGVEYRTTERYMGKPVYTKLVDFGVLPVNTYKTIDLPPDNIQYVIDSYGITNAGPKIPSMSFANGFWSNVVDVYVWGTGIQIVTKDWNQSSITAVVCIKYTKTTD